MIEPLLIHKSSGELVLDDPFRVVGTKLRYDGVTNYRYGIITETAAKNNCLDTSYVWAVYADSPQEAERKLKRPRYYPETRISRDKVTILTEEVWQQIKLRY